MPRIDLAAALNLGSGSVTRIASELAEYGLLQELDPLSSSEAGRRRIPVDLRAERFLVAGVHIGLRYTTCGLVDLRGRIVEGPRKLMHSDTEPQSVIEEAVEAVKELAGARPDESEIIGTGISSGGFVETVSGTVADHDALGWHDVDISALAGHRLDGLLTMESTYRAMAVAEMWFGAAQQTPNFVHMFMGNVVGAALVIDGTLYDGVNMRAGGIAHLPVSGTSVVTCACGRTGCLSSVAGFGATVERARIAGLDVRASSDVVKLARDGDERAIHLLRSRAQTVGEAVALLIDVLAPEKVVLAGAVLLLDDDLTILRQAVATSASQEVDAEAMVIPTALGEPFAANVVASATPVLKIFYDDPLACISQAPSSVEKGH